MRKLKYETIDTTVLIDAPTERDISDALLLIKEGDPTFFDIEDASKGDLFQVACISDDGYVFQFFSDIPNSVSLRSDSDDIPFQDALNFCREYLRNGLITIGQVSFSPIELKDDNRSQVAKTFEPSEKSWEDRCLEELTKNPQKFFNLTLKHNHDLTDQLPFLKLALEKGATLERFKPDTPLVYFAKYFRDSEVVDVLVELGCQVNAVYRGNSILWHAVSYKNFEVADALLARGAEMTSAASSPYYTNWLTFREKHATDKLITGGELEAVRLRIAGLSKNAIKYDWLTLAIIHDRLDVLDVLLQQKGKLHFRGNLYGTAFGHALTKTDTRYLEMLLRHGAYASVSQLETYGGMEFHCASPEALAFLIKNGYTAGLRSGVATIIRNAHRSKDQIKIALGQLAVIEDKFILELDLGDFLQAIALFASMLWMNRIAALLDQCEHAPIAQAVCDKGNLHDLSVMIMAGLTLGNVAANEQSSEAHACREYVHFTRMRLIEIARALGEF